MKYERLRLEPIPDVAWDYEDPAAGRLSIDHIMPKSQRGSGPIYNLEPAHLRCNIKKGGRAITNEQFRPLRSSRTRK